jgi:hypothetical protein
VKAIGPLSRYRIFVPPTGGRILLIAFAPHGENTDDQPVKKARATSVGRRIAAPTKYPPIAAITMAGVQAVFLADNETGPACSVRRMAPHSDRLDRP